MGTNGLDHGEPVAGVADMSWLDRAACGDLGIADVAAYFVDAGEAISRDALERCRACLVRHECLDHAYRRDVTSGYFGGMSPTVRRSLGRARALTDLARGAVTDRRTSVSCSHGRGSATPDG